MLVLNKEQLTVDLIDLQEVLTGAQFDKHGRQSIEALLERFENRLIEVDKCPPSSVILLTGVTQVTR